MISINFPEMISSTGTKLISDKDAINIHLHLLLSTEKRTLFGDPYYGCNLLQVYFEQRNSIIADVIIDEIYTAIVTFLPQLFVERKSITLKIVGNALYTEIQAVNRLDNSSNMYTIKLMDESLN